MTFAPKDTLRIGIIGTGFIAEFHLRSMIGVRNVTVQGVYSRNAENRDRITALSNELDLGPCPGFGSLEELVQSDQIDALWILSPNHTRLGVMETIHAEVKAGRSSIRAVACEKPLARTLREARRMVELVEDAGLLHGYLENQVFCTPVIRGKEIIWRRAARATGRPYLARAAEEHSGPHAAWFWQGDKQGGGALSDMMCHSVEVARHLLTDPEKPRESLKVKSATGKTSTLKWSRPTYADELAERYGAEVDFRNRPTEDFAYGQVLLEDEDGNEMVIEATTSWAYVGAGLRIKLEMLGPEYSMEFDSLSSGLKIFMSRRVSGAEGEDLVEKQNSEQGLMPVLEDEAGVYGYTDENRHMVDRFRKGLMPDENFHDGLAVVEILMALYLSAETQATVTFPCTDLDDYVPLVARAS
ncbi:Gfo/Idh/MocA family oxidoreductase [Rhodobacteraceae bacterium F11138]|nr:Gfo/Idh/MocA family oxidoreductase [Rhodobacteraceae bacterium F11138]